MKISVSEILSSQAYHDQATARAKANIFVATAVALYVMIFQNTGLGLWWYLIIPGLWFVASFGFALPFMLLIVWLGSLRSETSSFLSGRPVGPKANIIYLLQGIVHLANYVVLGIATYFGIHWLAGR